MKLIDLFKEYNKIKKVEKKKSERRNAEELYQLIKDKLESDGSDIVEVSYRPTYELALNKFKFKKFSYLCPEKNYIKITKRSIRKLERYLTRK